MAATCPYRAGSEGGYCACVLDAGHTEPHKCVHGWLE